MDVRIVDCSRRKTGSNHGVLVTESGLWYDDNKKRDFVVSKVNGCCCEKTDLGGLCIFEFKSIVVVPRVLLKA